MVIETKATGASRSALPYPEQRSRLRSGGHRRHFGCEDAARGALLVDLLAVAVAHPGKGLVGRLLESCPVQPTRGFRQHERRPSAAYS